MKINEPYPSYYFNIIILEYPNSYYFDSIIPESEELKDLEGSTPREEVLNARDSVLHSEDKESELQTNGSVIGKRLSFREKSPPGIEAVCEKDSRSKRGRKLIEKEKAEVGNVKLHVYKYYMKTVGFHMILIILAIQISTQGFGVSSNAWLGKWSDDDTIVIDGIVNTGKRNIYLGVYGAIGFGQGERHILSK